ncbi:MAG: hypothetical protein HY777_09550 [Betaproteobacteria bacterium]|nr:hypothetical protein [Betaproteobacteria bacterium]
MSNIRSFLVQPRSIAGSLAVFAALCLTFAPAFGADYGIKAKVAGNSAPPLFAPYSLPVDKSLVVAQDAQVIRARTVDVNRGLLTAGADGAVVRKKSISLNLFDDVSFVADAERVETGAQGLTWVGTLRGIERSQAVFVVTGDVVAGNITTPAGRYHIRFIGNGVHEVQQIDESKFPEEAHGEEAHGQGVPDVGGQKSASDTPAPDVQADDGSTIDVMVVYSPASRSAAGGTAAMQALISLGIAETNQTYQNSGITQRVRLVYSAEVAYTETGKILDALQCITSTTDGCLDSIHALRNTYGADLVSIWVEDRDYCGIANMMRTVSASFESQGFSAVSRSCATGYYSFGHEMGHNMGASHDVYVESSNLPYSYAHGFAYPQAASPWRTVMAYNDACQAAGKYCTRLPYWSNPSVTNGGVAMGNSRADNRLTLNNTARTVANFRAAISTPSCSTSLASASASVGAAASAGTVGVTTGAGCAWSAASNAGWITITSGASGNGSGTVAYSVQANTGSSSRTGTLSIAGKTFTVTQSGSTSTCTSVTLASSRTISGSLSSSDCIDFNSNGYNYYYDYFVFAGTPGQKVNLSVSTTQFDADLLLIAPDGSYLYSDDDGGGTAPVIAATLNQTGTYQIMLSSAIPLQAGSYSFVFTLGGAAGSGSLPDLVVASVSAGTQALAGGDLYISSVIKNQGSGSAAASDAWLYLSTNNVISTSDIDTGFACPIPALAAGESYSGCTGYISVPSTVSPGSYYFGVYADGDGVVPESNEANNSLAATSPTQVGASGTSSAINAIEYFHAGFGHYFITAAADEAAAIDAGIIKGWARTGQTFKVYPLNASGAANVCRFFSTSFAPKSSHFYTPSASECTFVKSNPNWQYEQLVFSVGATSSGACSSGLSPLYRLYNNGLSGAPNHRYTVSNTIVSTMSAQGWVSEGVIACVPN